MTCFEHRVWLMSVLTILVAGVACTRGADENRLKSDVQARLDHDVKPGLFHVVGLRREGSAPLPADESGAPRVVVYFNATLQLAQEYSFGGWDQLAPASVAYALGATEKGIVGLHAGNRQGDRVQAYGSAIYRQTPQGWTSTDAAPPTESAAVPNIEGTAPPSRSKQLIDRLASLVNLPPPGVPPQQDEIIADELARAAENIERRVKRRERVFTLATGPEDGEYARFGSAVIAAVNEAAPAVKLRQRNTAGSVDNAWLLARGEADYAIVQSDVAAAAVTGQDVFARGSPLDNLRAVGGLFPEAVHVVVLPDSPVRSIAQLRGRRVDIGQPASGTRFDALAVLGAHDLTPKDLAEAREDGPVAALARLKRKQIDAMFATAAAPTRALQQLAVSPGLRLLPVEGAAAERLVREHKGLSPLILPANTYLRQQTAVPTVAASALLLTTVDAPAAEVQNVADLVFTRMPRQSGLGADVIKVSGGSELRGITVPLHPGAGRQDPEGE